jgi:4-amino-4-deoxy-L-arabinose transferase-like glycosyltransferase
MRIIKERAKIFMWLAIISLALFFRLYNFEGGFIFAHDHDLYSWIAKDLLVNKHWRLVGQVTSVPGVFIGPLYYYLIAFFYFLFRMNPLSAVIPLTLIGLAGVFSFYYFLKTYFGNKTGLIGAFLWACTWGVASFER